jgi:hypothetical protein
MKRLDATLLLWAEALASERGVEITASYLESVEIDQRQLVADLYEARKLAGDSRLFQFYIHQVGGEVWIVRCAAPPIKSDGEYEPLEDS